MTFADVRISTHQFEIIFCWAFWTFDQNPGTTTWSLKPSCFVFQLFHIKVFRREHFIRISNLIATQQQFYFNVVAFDWSGYGTVWLVFYVKIVFLHSLANSLGTSVQLSINAGIFPQKHLWDLAEKYSVSNSSLGRNTLLMSKENCQTVRSWLEGNSNSNIHSL